MMKTLESYILEKETKEAVTVFVVKDSEDGSIIGIYDTEEGAQTAKKEYECTPDMKAEISKEDRSEFVKD